CLVIPAIVAGVVREAGLEFAPALGPFTDFASAMVAAAVFQVLNVWLAFVLLSLRTDQSVLEALRADTRGILGSMIALAPLSWLMTVVYAVQWWATALFAVPLYSTRLGARRSHSRSIRPGWRTRASSRCARCSPRPSAPSPKPSTSATRLPPSTASASRTSRSISVQGCTQATASLKRS